MLESVVLTVVISLCVTCAAVVIMQKLFEEQRKQSERATKEVAEIFNGLSQTVLTTYSELMKREKERQEKEWKEAEQKNYERMTRTEMDI